MPTNGGTFVLGFSSAAYNDIISNITIGGFPCTNPVLSTLQVSCTAVGGFSTNIPYVLTQQSGNVYTATVSYLIPTPVPATQVPTNGGSFVVAFSSAPYNDTITNITIGGVPCSNPVLSLIPPQVTCTATGGYAQNVSYVVTQLSGNSYRAVVSYLVPTVVSMLPVFLPTNGGPVTLTFSSAIRNVSINSVTVGGVNATQVSTPTAVQISFVVQGGSAQNTPIIVYLSDTQVVTPYFC